jgi:hypothetical protein
MIQDAIQANEQHIPTLLNMATEAWRFSKVFHRAVAKLDAGEQGRFVSQYRYFIKKLEDGLSEAGYTLVNLEGQIFDPGMAATPLNIEDFAPDDKLFVEQMIEPVIMGSEGLIKMGTVILGKVTKL